MKMSATRSLIYYVFVTLPVGTCELITSKLYLIHQSRQSVFNPPGINIVRVDITVSSQDEKIIFGFS